MMGMIKKKLQIEAYGCSEIGNARFKNEDYFGISDNVFIVADGMGGHKAGEVASKLTVETIIDFFNNFYNNEFNKKKENKIDYQRVIDKALKKTNQDIKHKSQVNFNYNNMATTIVFSLFQKPDIMHIANVGDSRAYLFRKGELKIITEDHSLTGEMFRQGYITEDEIKNHPYRNQLTRAIGINGKIEEYYTSLELFTGDKIILCSDGFWNVISEKEIKNILLNDESSQKNCNDLIKLAKNYKGSDDITAIVINVKDG